MDFYNRPKDDFLLDTAEPNGDPDDDNDDEDCGSGENITAEEGRKKKSGNESLYGWPYDDINDLPSFPVMWQFLA